MSTGILQLLKYALDEPRSSTFRVERTGTARELLSLLHFPPTPNSSLVLFTAVGLGMHRATTQKTETYSSGQNAALLR